MDSSETRLSSVKTIRLTRAKPTADRENKVRTEKLQPVFTAACVDADPDQSKDARGGFIRLRLQQLIVPHAPAASGIDTVQGKYVLGEIDAEKDNGGDGHFLALTGSGLESRNPMVAPGRSPCMRENLRRRGDGLGDGPFIC